MLQFNRRQFISSAGAFTLASFAATNVANASSRRVLRVAMPMLPAVMEPVDSRSIGVPAYRVQNSVFDRLLQDDGATGRGALAETITKVDETTYRIGLRAATKFHNGGTVSIDDVLFSLGEERLTGDKAPGLSVKKTFLSNLKGVQPTDAGEILVSLERPDPIFVKRAAAWGTQIVSESAYREAVDYDRWAAHPVGSGPYVLREFRPGELIEVVANPVHWAGKPKFDAVQFYQVPELLTRVIGLQSGEYDLVTDVTPDQFETIKGYAGLDVVGGSAAGYQMILFDVNGTELLRHPSLRRALSLSIDRTAIVDALWGGNVTVPNGYQIPAYGDLYDAARPQLAFNPDLARELLNEAGYTGQEIPYRMVPNYYPNQLETGQILVEMWRQVGINVRLELVEDIAQIYKAQSGCILDGTIVMHFPDPVSTSWRRYGSANPLQTTWKWWSNSEYNELGTVLETATNLAERKAAFHRMLDIIEDEDLPGILLHTTSYFYGKREEIEWSPGAVAVLDFS